MGFALVILAALHVPENRAIHRHEQPPLIKQAARAQYGAPFFVCIASLLWLIFCLPLWCSALIEKNQGERYAHAPAFFALNRARTQTQSLLRRQ
jgi:MFS-type transporter involved in bile tolerance (Atg22 family)